MRLSSKNMCSVRQSPMPSAPSPRATSASRGVSAFVRTRKTRCSSTHCMNVSSDGVNVAAVSGSRPTITSPLVPLRLSQSPSRTVTLPFVIVFWRTSIVTSPQPATHGLPQPRATTAAWLVMPPRDVSTPSAACMPATSSGLVSTRTSTTRSPRPFHSSASSARKTTRPTAAPGDAARPFAITRPALR
jgi:hypothetical protein